MFNKMKSIKVLQMVESPLNSFSKIEEILIKQMILHIQKEQINYNNFKIRKLILIS